MRLGEKVGVAVSKLVVALPSGADTLVAVVGITIVVGTDVEVTLTGVTVVVS